MFRGYGEVKRAGEKMLDHRASYEMNTGLIPDGRYVCHKCDNPPCVRPDHLYLGTCRDNIQDSVKKGRFGACKLSPDQVVEIRELAKSIPQKHIAHKFGVRPNTISQIVTGVRWASIH